MISNYDLICLVIKKEIEKNEACFLTDKQISLEVGLKMPTINKYIKKLVENGTFEKKSYYSGGKKVRKITLKNESEV